MKIEIKPQECSTAAQLQNGRFTFNCSFCHGVVEADELIFGRRHIYAKHCNFLQEIGIVY